MNAGDTFRPANRAVDIHLWVIISDPAKDDSQVLIVSLTSYKPYKEGVCLLNVGDHQSITQQTCIAYNLANAPSLAQLEQARVNGDLIPDEPVAPDVLQRIRDGAALSTKLSIEHYQILDNQGLV